MGAVPHGPFSPVQPVRVRQRGVGRLPSRRVTCRTQHFTDPFLAGLDSPETAAAMAQDGVKRETVKVYVMDKEFQP